MIPTRFVAAALAIVMAALSALPTAPSPAALPPPPQAAAVNQATLEASYEQQLFFAVLEGCFRDGIDDELVDLIVATDPATHQFANFVYACPICMPVIRAFNTYRASPLFVGSKTEGKAFGVGIDAELARKLRSSNLLERQGALHSLVQAWIEQWLATHRVTEEERTMWRAAMDEGRKLGMKLLESYRGQGGSYGLMKECPSCEACNGACGKGR